MRYCAIGKFQIFYLSYLLRFFFKLWRNYDAAFLIPELQVGEQILKTDKQKYQWRIKVHSSLERWLNVWTAAKTHIQILEPFRSDPNPSFIGKVWRVVGLELDFPPSSLEAQNHHPYLHLNHYPPPHLQYHRPYPHLNLSPCLQYHHWNWISPPLLLKKPQEHSIRSQWR